MVNHLAFLGLGPLGVARGQDPIWSFDVHWHRIHPKFGFDLLFPQFSDNFPNFRLYLRPYVFEQRCMATPFPGAMKRLRDYLSLGSGNVSDTCSNE